MTDTEDRSHAFGDTEEPELGAGHEYLFAWLVDHWGDTAKGVMQQFLVFYLFMLLGFIALYIMIKSTGQVRARLKDLRKNVAEVLQEQMNRPWDADDCGRLPGGGLYF